MNVCLSSISSSMGYMDIFNIKPESDLLPYFYLHDKHYGCHVWNRNCLLFIGTFVYLRFRWYLYCLVVNVLCYCYLSLCYFISGHVGFFSIGFCFLILKEILHSNCYLLLLCIHFFGIICFMLFCCEKDEKESITLQIFGTIRFLLKISPFYKFFADTREAKKYQRDIQYKNI